MKRVLAICSARKPPHMSTVSVACSATSAVFGLVGTSSSAAAAVAAAAPVSPSPSVRSPVHEYRPCQHCFLVMHDHVSSVQLTCGRPHRRRLWLRCAHILCALVLYDLEHRVAHRDTPALRERGRRCRLRLPAR